MTNSNIDLKSPLVKRPVRRRRLGKPMRRRRRDGTTAGRRAYQAARCSKMNQI